MAKRVVWTLTAKTQRREILAYWIKRNGNKKYSRWISAIIRRRIKYLAILTIWASLQTLMNIGLM